MTGIIHSSKCLIGGKIIFKNLQIMVNRIYMLGIYWHHRKGITFDTSRYTFFDLGSSLMSVQKFELFAVSLCPLHSESSYLISLRLQFIITSNHHPQGLCHEETNDDKITLFFLKLTLLDRILNSALNYKISEPMSNILCSTF